MVRRVGSWVLVLGLVVIGAVACGGGTEDGGGSDVVDGPDTGTPGLPGDDASSTPGDASKPDGEDPGPVDVQDPPPADVPGPPPEDVITPPEDGTGGGGGGDTSGLDEPDAEPEPDTSGETPDDIYTPSCDEESCRAEDCRICDADGACVTVCAESEFCEEGGVCSPLPTPCDDCDPDACEACGDGPDGPACLSACMEDACELCDGAGACVSACEESEVCAAGTCRAVLDCSAPSVGGYCDASVVSSLLLAEEGGCDFTGNGTPDNGALAVIGLVGGFTELSVDELNLYLTENIQDGLLLLLLEYVGLAPGAADTPSFDINLFMGGDADSDPTLNFTGDGELYVLPESMSAEGDALVTFPGASVLGGTLTAGPSRFNIPISIPDMGLHIVIAVEEAAVTAAISSTPDGYALSNGTLCGLVMESDVVKILNDFVEASCGCLNLDGPLVSPGLLGGWSCASAPASTCSSFDEMGSMCSALAQYCGMVAPMLPMLLDVDLDGDNSGDAVSFGARLEATSALIVPGE